MKLTYGSVCSGIEAASVAWEPLGWSPEWFAEIEQFPSSVLAHHWPHVPNLGDMTLIHEWVSHNYVNAPDVLVGGTPCQAFSVAGARKGLSDDRGFLTIKFVELANAIDQQRVSDNNEPSIIVWENVPGVLSSKDNAFGAFLGFLAGEDCELIPPGGRWTNAGCVLGPQRAIAWRVLDAQYFGVAQRRRRVFVVASAREGFDPAAVLFESEGLRRDIAPSREAPSENEHASQARLAGGGDVFGCLMRNVTTKHWLGNQEAFAGSYHIVGHDGRIRNSTLLEITRLQGFPDNFFSRFSTDYWKCAGALGNSMAVPCMRWIGERIQQHLTHSSRM